MTEQVNLQKGLEHLYKMDSEWFDGSDVLDKSPNRRHATASGGVTVGANSYLGGAADFDGVDDEFTAPGAGAFDELTVAVIYKSTNTSFDLLDSGLFNNGGWAVYESGGGNNLALYIQDESGNTDQIGVGTPPVDEWNLSLFEFNGTKVTAYLNGDVKNVEDTTVSTFNSTHTLHIGSRNASPRQFFDGVIAFAAVWHRTLNDAEIEAVQNMKGPMYQQL